MIEIGGKQIPTTIEELVNPRFTAVLNVDLQNDSISTGGQRERAGKDVSMCQAIIPRLARLLSSARDLGSLVLYTQNLSLPGHKSDSPAWLRFKTRTGLPKGDSDYSQEGSWGRDFVAEVKPQPGDLVIKKYRSSAFHATNLDLILRSNGIKTVIVTGVITEGCVEATARTATFYDYFVVVLKDCVGTFNPELHNPAMKLLEAHVDILTSGEILKAWDKVR